MCKHPVILCSGELFSRKVGKQNIHSEVIRFLKTCEPKLFFKNFLALYYQKYCYEFLYNINNTIFGIFKKMFSISNHQQKSNHPLYEKDADAL